MASLNSWLSPGVMHALGWTLIHSLWQCLGVAALAASLMAFSRRPSIRYLVAVGALALMLAVPVATFFALATAPAHAFHAVSPGSFISDGPETAYTPPAVTVNAAPVATTPTAMDNGAIGSLENLPRAFPSQSNFPPNILPWLVGAWFAGVALFSLRFAGGFLLVEHRRRRQSIAPSPRIVAICQEVQRQLGLDRAVRYLECSWLQAPAVIGWFRPIILLPVSALTGLSEEQLRAVVAHELAHIRRLDAFVNLFQILVEALLFYHPAMWWLNKRIRDERELCCDEIAVSVTGSRVEYARALTLMAAWRNAPVLAMAANRGPLSMRILHILGRKPFGAGQRMMGLTGGALFLAAALAAANALFGIAYPIPIAHAKESVRAALSSGQTVVDRAVRRALLAATEDTVPDQPSRSDATSQETASVDQIEKLVPPSPNLSGLLPRESLVAPTVVASSAAPAAIANDQSVASTAPVTRDAPVGPTSETVNNQAAPPAKASSNELPTTSHWNEQPAVWQCHNTNIFGRVISPKAIQMPGFNCITGGAPAFYGRQSVDTCPDASADSGRADLTSADRLEGAGRLPCKVDVTMNVRLADPADAGKMQPGKIVRLGGNFLVARERSADYLTVENAKVLEIDPLTTEESTKALSLLLCQPPQLVELSKQLGRRLCVQSDIVANLNVTGPDLQAAARSLLGQSARNERSDDPNAITCRKRVYVRLPSSVTCAFNSYWKSWVSQQSIGQFPDVGPFYNSGNTGGSGFTVIGGAGWQL